MTRTSQELTEARMRKELAEARARAVAEAVCGAVKHPGSTWTVIRFEKFPYHFMPADVATLASLAPHAVEAPTYRAIVNSDLTVSIVNGAHA